ncbi:phage tail length tape measure family protein, partial [Mycobacterium kansasii]
HHVTNLGYQLNDIGMMMAMGQNPFMLMIQQGPQVAQILGDITQAGGDIASTLRDAFSALLNPTTLVTLAVIGGAAAFVQWAMSGRDASV